MSRQKVKRVLLDELDAKHKFGPPPSLVEDEFNNVWKTIQDDLAARKRTFEDEGTTEEKAKDEYRGIAERRVRLGLVIAEIGEQERHQGDRRGTEPRRDGARAAGAGAGAEGLGILPQQSRRACRACVRRSSRTRSSTTSSNSPRSPTRR